MIRGCNLHKIIKAGACCVFLFLVQFLPGPGGTLNAQSNLNVNLNIPFHRQEHNLSCELAALKMALNFKGVKISESQLIRDLPAADPYKKIGNVWGDPNLGFVGNIDGYMPNTGYGVYAQPIKDLARKYRPAQSIHRATLEDLVNELKWKNPVIVWTVIGEVKNISWKTPEGTKIIAYQTEHAQIFIGYTGTAENIKNVILLDPIYGKIYWSKQKFLERWGLLNRQAVVVK